MSIDAVAIIHCRDPRLLETLAKGPVGEDYSTQLRSLNDAVARGTTPPIPLSLTMLGVGADVLKLYTGVGFAGLQADVAFATRIAKRVLELLPPGAHHGSELLFYPDAAEPSAITFDALVAELQGACVRVALHG